VEQVEVMPLIQMLEEEVELVVIVLHFQVAQN
jgi:hypothetical protein